MLLQPLTWAFNLLLPPECAWCQRPIDDDRRLCADCHAVFTSDYSCCFRCAMPVPEVVDRSSCIRCRDEGWRFERAVALGPYRGRLREAIILMKRPVFESLAMAAGELLAAKLQREQVAFDVIVPVPNHWSRRLAHKTSAAETLASAIAAHCPGRLVLTAAQRCRRTQKQGMLAWSNRPTNVKHAFRIARPKLIAQQRVLLVDDVLTSGATAAELTRCLLKSGAASVHIAVAARGTGSKS